MKKAAIIAQILGDMGHAAIEKRGNVGRDPDAEKTVIDALETLLKEIEPDANIQTCSDFGHLKWECCEICHTNYPHFEMSLLDVEGGGKAWICCAVDRALNPQKHSEFKSSSAYKTLVMILGGSEDT